ncbi:MAG: hypothetical protein WD875_12145 [Pirellulales bacterium]
MATANPAANRAADPPLAERLLRPWNAFWFTPRDTATVSIMRIATGLVAIYWAATYTPDLVHFFGPDGFVPLADLQRARGSTFPRSLLEFCNTSGSIWAFHAASLVILALFTVGFVTPLTGLLSVVAVVSYIQRAPAVTSQAESVLVILLLYLSIAPLGTRLSLDSLLRRNSKAAPSPSTSNGRGDERSWLATVSTRLIQVHLTIAYAAMALAKLNDGVPDVDMGTYHAWWHGQAVWWLAARQYSPLFDVSGLLTDNLLLVNAWTHAIVLFEAGFAIFVWRPAFRRCLLWAAVPMWLSLAVITGLVPFCLLMLIGNLAFVEPAAMQRFLSRFANRNASLS